MPKVKHGRRSYHYKPKYHEQSQRAKLHDITNIEGANLGVEPAPESTGTNVFQQLSCKNFSIQNWHVYREADYVELSLFHNSPPKPTLVKFSVTVEKDLHLLIKVYGKPLTSPLPMNHPTTISSVRDLQQICTSLLDLNVCSGNDDDAFVELFRNKRTETGCKAYIDTDFIADTVRHRDCSLVCTGGTKCEACQSYRPTLRAMNSRSKKAQPSSRTNSRMLKVNSY